MSAIATSRQNPDQAALVTTLRDALRAQAPPALCVAYSGGPDSTALLHALAQLPAARDRGLRALHVDHGLHPDSAQWAEHCRRFCATLDVPLTCVRVEVGDDHGEGVEAAARRARHAAFAGNLDDGEWLALGHHRDDQIETVLLKLLRGAGPEGLGGMRSLRPLGAGFLWRPLLETTRDSICNYLNDNKLSCIDDPANRDLRFGRNILRHEILPRLARGWPQAGAAIVHSARLSRAAADFIAGEAQRAWLLLSHPDGTLDADGWSVLPDALRAPVLDTWLRDHGLPVPSDAQRRELERQAGTAADDAQPCVAWPGAEVRIWNGCLHAMPPLAPLPEHWQTVWTGAPLALPAGCGTLVLAPLDGEPTQSVDARLDPPLTVRLRRGGECIKPTGDAHTRQLRDLFQQARIPPWVRERCPLVFAGDELVAVGDLWSSTRGEAVFDASDARPAWIRPAWLNVA